MASYQLRLSGTLATLCDRVTDRVWREAAEFAGDNAVDGYEAVAEAVRRTLHRYARRRPITHAAANERLTRPLWVESSASGADHGSAPDEVAYDLHLAEGLQDFLYEMAIEIWRHLYRDEVVRERRMSPEARWLLADAARDALAASVYRQDSRASVGAESASASSRAAQGD